MQVAFVKDGLHLLWTHTPSHRGDLEPELYRMPICMRCDRRSGVSNIFSFHLYFGKQSHLADIFQLS